MSARDLKTRYGKNKNTQQAINAAIRAELPGGGQALDALEAIRDFGRDPLPPIRDVVEAMALEIRRRYAIGPPAPAGDPADQPHRRRDEDERAFRAALCVFSAIECGLSIEQMFHEVTQRHWLPWHDVKREELDNVLGSTLQDLVDRFRYRAELPKE